MTSDDGISNVVSFAKRGVSESVLRKALYWLSQHSDWHLDDSGEHYCVRLSDSLHIPTLHRLVNDFALREAHDRKTEHARTRVVAAALERLSRTT